MDSDDVREEDLIEYFSRAGEIVALKFLYDRLVATIPLLAAHSLNIRQTKAFKGCAFVEFRETEAADYAKELTGGSIAGRMLRVGDADDEPGGLAANGTSPHSRPTPTSLFSHTTCTPNTLQEVLLWGVMVGTTKKGSILEEVEWTNKEGDARIIEEGVHLDAALWTEKVSLER